MRKLDMRKLEDLTSGGGHCVFLASNNDAAEFAEDAPRRAVDASDSDSDYSSPPSALPATGRASAGQQCGGVSAVECERRRVRAAQSLSQPYDSIFPCAPDEDAGGLVTLYGFRVLETSPYDSSESLCNMSLLSLSLSRAAARAQW